MLFQDFAKRATAACGKDVTELTKTFAGLQPAQAPYVCLDLSFCHTVLTQGFDLPEDAAITLVKQVSSCWASDVLVLRYEAVCCSASMTLMCGHGNTSV